MIHVHDVSKSFRRNVVLDRANLSVGSGETLAITGPNGSGKSILLKLMCRLMRPDSGVVHIASQFVEGAHYPRDFGIVIDRPGYIASYSGLENLLALAGIRKLVSEAEVRSSMERVGLDPDLPQAVGRYSLGMKQKLALAQAIMENQRVLLLDEPFNALDEASVEAIRALLRRFKEEGRTIVFTSHHREDVAALADREVVIIDGRVQPK